MMPSQSTNVFVSYSHADTSLVAPVVKLLRVNKSLVFQDNDGIQPGKKWQSEIDKALADSHLVVVFWCYHSSQSNEVAKEWKTAIEQEKDLLPLLLDETPLPPELDEFQWIDFRGTVGASHRSPVLSSKVAAEYAPPSMSARRWFAPFAGLGLATALATAVVLLSVYTTTRTYQPQSKPPITLPPENSLPNPVWVQPKPPMPLPHSEAKPRGKQPKPVEPPVPLPSDQPKPGTNKWGREYYAFVFSFLVVLAWLFRRLWRFSRKAEKITPAPSEIASPYLAGIERIIASKLEAEILRRTASRRDGGS